MTFTEGSNAVKRDRGLVADRWNECKGCGLCVEACPPKVIHLSDRAESLRISHGDLCGRGLHGMRNLLSWRVPSRAQSQ